jgi:hypothetical protein
MQVLKLANNEFNGTVPALWTAVGAFPALTTLDIRDNWVEGEQLPMAAHCRWQPPQLLGTQLASPQLLGTQLAAPSWLLACNPRDRSLGFWQPRRQQVQGICGCIGCAN